MDSSDNGEGPGAPAPARGGPVRPGDGGWQDADLFAGAGSPALDLLSRHAFVQRVPAGASLAEEGEHPRLLHVLLEGLAQLSSEHDGHATGIGLVEPVAPVMLSAVLFERPCLTGLQTLAPCRFLLVPADAVRSAFAEDAGFARACARALAADERRAIREIKNQKLRTVPERLANWILARLPPGGEPRRIHLPFGKHVLASQLGATRERLSRSFALLEEHGLRVGRRDLEVADPERLRAYARPHPLIDDENV